MSVEWKEFGKSESGQEVKLYTISNSKGMKASVTNYGAILVSLLVPDANGQVEDVVLGFDTVEGYYSNPSFFGATIGPSANRIGGAKFTVDGVTYQLDVNDNENNLHSHKALGYHKKVWDAEILENGVCFSLSDEDGFMGFPGNKKFQVTYTVDEENGLNIQYHATSDKKTIINPTNHTYFNLDGHKAGSIEDHEMWIQAATYTPVGEGSIPTGEIASVTGTPMDFTTAKVVGLEINAQTEQLELTGGYDHNWVIDGWDGQLKHFATVVGPKSGRRMKVYTTLPGVQFYAGNFIDPQQGKDGAVYEKRSGLCLETQYYPDSANKPNFPSCIFGEDKEYNSVTVYRFE